MKYLIAVYFYLLIGGFIIGKAEISHVKDCGTPAMSMQEFAITAATWPAALGAGLAITTSDYDVKTCKKPQ